MAKKKSKEAATQPQTNTTTQSQGKAVAKSQETKGNASSPPSQAKVTAPAQKKTTAQPQEKAVAKSQATKGNTSSSPSQAKVATQTAKPFHRKEVNKQIRNDVYTMYEKNRSVDKIKIASSYIFLYPEKESYIRNVLDGYATIVKKKNPTPKPSTKEPKTQNMVPKKETPKVEQHKQALPKNTQCSTLLKKPDQTAECSTTKSKFTEYLSHKGPHSEPAIHQLEVPSLENQMQFLNLDHNESMNGHTAPRLQEVTLLSPITEGHGHKMPPQFALLGHQPSKMSAGFDPRVMLNTNIPFSAFICGVQGSGKSHTTSCIIENCTFSLPSLGVLKNPLSTLVLQFNEYSSNISSQPSEAAFLSSVMPEYRQHLPQVPVTVLVSPSNFYELKKLYSQIPGVQVLPFRLQPRHLSVSTMLSLMSIGKGDSMPLYMAQVTTMLRQMAEENKGPFDYLAFRRRLKSLDLQRTQTPFLEQRLDLLDSFLDLKGEVRESYFVNNRITILDLSCPFVDKSTACILFRIATRLFLDSHTSRGKMIVADEAHKYMTDDTPATMELTEEFLNIVRQQRHHGVRLVISTQEPTISPRLIDLCSMTIIHRFSSPEWYQSIRNHITIGYMKDNSAPEDAEDGLYQISNLRTGEALVFAPSAYILDENQSMRDTKHRAFKLAVRKRVTWDGGQSILSVK
ncbi:hypothetical protein MGYG_05109 [Nannizzia gypsea CBS 118893]|uniref:Zona occludens toxin N-terminal domain-containing protein n=1 Tax=Arthroderma gypseum (strain ATCC MYA-4604 / CBS 118893) TaxID=535722 RepID=E4UYE4_ARTGP|nr:hypothetical protein MGYG_05109 [Nannizzia gypsea CBS 118893]EFR02107.1 hypothetical protein MGYG_05109 [Nannizzia gypsea CBS 118893]